MASKGDFTGFYFNGRHSSELGITRISDGSRYNDNLLPTFQDKTAVVAGGDGTYFWNSYYTQKPFPLNFAFDNVTEEQYRELRRWLGTREIHELIFDESPYKKYMVKVTGTPQMKTVCFNMTDSSNELYDIYIPAQIDNKGGKRIYKGEGTIQFVAYFPYAKSTYKWLSDYTTDKPEFSNWQYYVLTKDAERDSSKIYYYWSIKDQKYVESKYEEDGKPVFKKGCRYYELVSGLLYNIEEWKGASGMEDTQGVYDGIGKSIKLYNPGDIETDFCLYCNDGITNIALTGTDAILGFNPFSLKDGDSKICINSKTNLIEGVDANLNPTGTLYNEYVKNGDFFKIPLGESEITIADGTGEIKYDYLYY